MMIRHAEAKDLKDIFCLAEKSGVGFTSLPVNIEILSKRITRTRKTLKNEVLEGDKGYLFVLEDLDSNRVVGLSAIEVAVEKSHIGRCVNFRLSLGKYSYHFLVGKRLGAVGPELIGHGIVTRQTRTVIQQMPNRNAFVGKFRNISPHIGIVIQFALRIQNHNCLSRKHFRIGRKLELVVDTQRIRMPAVEFTHTESLFIYHLSLLSIQNHAVHSRSGQIGEKNIRRLVFFCQIIRFQIGKNAIDIN